MLSKLFIIFCIFLVGLFVFWSSFQLGLYGDEWKILWLAKSTVFASGKIIPATDSSYGFEIIVFYLLSFLGDQGWIYYVFSFCCRFLTVIALAWFFRKRGFPFFIAAVCGLLFLVSPIGIEATDWVRNFDSYLGIALFLICFDAILNIKNWSDMVTICFSFALAALINPIRSPGFLLVIGSVLVSRLSQVNSQLRKILLITGVCLMAIFLLFINLNIFGGQISGHFFDEGVHPQEQIKSLIGNFADTVVPNIPTHDVNLQVLSLWLLLLIILVWKIDLFNSANLKKVFIFLHILAGLWLTSLAWNGSGDFAVSIRIGLYITLFLVLISVIEFKQRKMDDFFSSLFILSCGYLFMLIPSIRQPTFQANFDHRYLIHSALIVPFILFFSWKSVHKGASNFFKKLEVIVICLTIISFSLVTIEYFNHKRLEHGEDYSKKVWNSIYLATSDIDFSNKTGVIITADPETASKIGSSVQFGFGFHMGLLYKMWNENNLPYLINDDKKVINSLITDGTGSEKYLSKRQVISSDTIIVLQINNTVVKRIPLHEFLSNDQMKNVNP